MSIINLLEQGSVGWDRLTTTQRLDLWNCHLLMGGENMTYSEFEAKVEGR